MEWLTVLGLGFLLGMKHSTDADHVVAVTTIVSTQKKLSLASKIGMIWGFGHTLTILVIGSAIIYLQFSISPALGLSMEFSVGVMIVILGLWSLQKFVFHGHAHRNQAHAVQAASTDKLPGWIRPLIVGLIHGMAGSAAVALLVLNAISNQKLAFVYLLIFGLGTVAGMMLVTVLIGLPYIYSKNIQSLNRGLGIATAVFSIGFGLLMMYELGFENGLFTGHPVWTPE